MEYSSNLDAYHSKPHYLRQTTAKTGNYTGANVTCADSNQKKYRKLIKSEMENDFTVATKQRHKSFTSRKLNFYSDIEPESDKLSNWTVEIRPSLKSATKEEGIKPNVIKGFWSSEASSPREIKPPVLQENPVELKYDFYNSGIQFYDHEQVNT